MIQKEANHPRLPRKKYLEEWNRPYLRAVGSQQLHEIDALSLNRLGEEPILDLQPLFVPDQQLDEAMKSNLNGDLKRCLLDLDRRAGRLPGRDPFLDFVELPGTTEIDENSAILWRERVRH